MRTCSICGKEIPKNGVHLIYAFVGSGETDIAASELCPEHTNQFIDFVGAKE